MLIWLARALAAIIDFLRGRPVVGRSPQWSDLRDKWLSFNPVCAACGVDKKLEVHHILPVHVAPQHELDWGNLITFCRRCHLLVGHCDDWLAWNEHCVGDALAIRNRIANRRLFMKFGERAV